MSRPGLYDRLRRLGVPPRTTTGVVLDETTVKAALDTHGSVNAAAKALGVPRARLGAEAVRLGLRPPPPSIPPTSRRSTSSSATSTPSPPTTTPAPSPQPAGYAASASPCDQADDHETAEDQRRTARKAGQRR